MSWKYVWIWLDSAEYAWIFLKTPEKKNGSEYVKTANVSDEVHSIKLLYKILSSYQDRGVFRTLSNI